MVLIKHDLYLLFFKTENVFRVITDYMKDSTGLWTPYTVNILIMFVLIIFKFWLGGYQSGTWISCN